VYLLTNKIPQNIIEVNKKTTWGLEMDKEKNVLTVEDLAKELGISRNLVYRQVRSGKIYSIKLGDRYLIPLKTLEKLLEGK
jgi:excisionase family DNA binding protein